MNFWTDLCMPMNINKIQTQNPSNALICIHTGSDTSIP